MRDVFCKNLIRDHQNYIPKENSCFRYMVGIIESVTYLATGLSSTNKKIDAAGSHLTINKYSLLIIIKNLKSNLNMIPYAWKKEEYDYPRSIEFNFIFSFLEHSKIKKAGETSIHWHVGCSLWVLLRSFSFLEKVLAKTGYTFFVFYISFEVWRGCKRVLLFLTWIEKKIKKINVFGLATSHVLHRSSYKKNI